MPHPTPANAEQAKRQWPDVTVDSLEQGRSLYVARCGSCHSLYLPSSFDATGWQERLGLMAPRARLNDDERTLVYKYLVTIGTAQSGQIAQQ
jgi:hypothetical protein